MVNPAFIIIPVVVSICVVFTLLSLLCHGTEGGSNGEGGAHFGGAAHGGGLHHGHAGVHHGHGGVHLVGVHFGGGGHGGGGGGGGGGC